MKFHCFIACLLLGLTARGEAATVKDGMGQPVSLDHPAQRIVSLTPHATELLFAAGAGASVVATVDYSDYPPAAKRLPKVGGLSGISLEAVVRARPDLVVAWQDGTDARLLARLKAMGIPVFISHPLTLYQIAQEMRSLGQLSGTQAVANCAAVALERRAQALAKRYQHAKPIKVFYQVGAHPLFAVTNRSFIGQMIQMCGAKNVFANLPMPALQTSSEAVLRLDPDLIVAGDAQSLTIWSKWPQLAAVKYRNLYTVPEDELARPGPRLIVGAEALCHVIDLGRQHVSLTP